MKIKESPVRQGQIIDVKVIDLTATGEGVAKYKDFIIFIENTVPGDEAEVKITTIKKQYAKAELIKLISPSPDRRENPYCLYCENCGGCSFNLLNYQKQLKIKQNIVENDLKRIGGFNDLVVLPIIGSSDELHYRNKAQYKVSSKGLGLYKKKSHDLVQIQNCQIQSPETSNLIPLLNTIIKHHHLSIYNEVSHKGLLRSILVRSNREGEVIIVFIINGKVLPDAKKIVEELKTDPNVIGIYINSNTKKGNTILGDKITALYEKKPLIETIGDKKFVISPTSFFQVNPTQTEILYQTVKDFADLKPGETLYDLYCGTGTIGIYLYKDGVKLIGIESNEEAIKDAKENAQLNNINSAEFLSGKAEEVTPKLKEKPDCVILDPPRKGCDASLLNLLGDLKPKRIVYVSCNPATLARDLKLLNENYTIDKIQPIDMFPQTGHVETVVLLTRRNNTQSS